MARGPHMILPDVFDHEQAPQIVQLLSRALLWRLKMHSMASLDSPSSCWLAT
jgi:hypothetical protein